MLVALYDYWRTKRGSRAMPSRSDIDPIEIPKLLPWIIMYDVLPVGGYAIRLLGEEIASFLGRDATGETASDVLTPRGAEMAVQVLDSTVAERAPKFRAGKAYWSAEKDYSDFEACFLPMSPDDRTVDIILGGVRFPVETA
jgi:hypothetical protein